MHVTTKGQVTIPQRIREKYNITANSEVDFIDEDGKIILVKMNNNSNRKNKFNKVRGIATVKLTTEDYRGLNPLFYNYINPYGSFQLNMDKRFNFDKIKIA